MDEPACFHGLRNALDEGYVITSSTFRGFKIARLDDLPLIS